MRQPVVLTLVFLCISFAWQVILWTALPNVGMGGLGVMYLIWPLLALSTICLWFVLKRFPTHQVLIFLLVSIVMLAVTLAVHPQDSPISLAEKVKTLSSFLAAT